MIKKLVGKRWWGVMVGVMLASPAWAVKEYYSLSRSTRALGMGGAFYGISDDEYASFYNPAGLSLYQGEGQWMIHTTGHLSSGGINSGKKLIDTLGETSSIEAVVTGLEPLQGDPLYAGASLYTHYTQKHFNIGLLFADVKGQFALLGRDFDTQMDVTVISDSGLFLSYARAPFEAYPGLHFGVTGKAVFRAGGTRRFEILELAQGGNINLQPNQIGGVGLGIDFDLGTIYEIPTHLLPPFVQSSQLSFSLNNLLATAFTGFRSGGDPPQLPRMFTLASAVRLQGWGPVDHFLLLSEISEVGLGGQSDIHLGNRGGSFWKHVNLGLEAPFRGWFRPRVGFRQGLFTLGLGFNFQYIKLDFAWYAEELGTRVGLLNKRRFALTLAIGAGSPPPAPARRTELWESVETKKSPPPPLYPHPIRGSYKKALPRYRGKSPQEMATEAMPVEEKKKKRP